MSIEMSLRLEPLHRLMSQRPLEKRFLMLAKAVCYPMESDFGCAHQQWISNATT